MDHRYQLRERIGVGGMSVVWRAHDEVLERDVAVKVLSAAAAPDPARLSRIRLEARAAAALKHPHIVEVYDYGESPGEPGCPPLPYVVMELVEGRPLAGVLAQEALPWRTAVHLCAQVAAALAAAHARGVVHRDVKPANVMVTPTGAKLLDFGISAVVGAADETDGELLGTPAYLAPERLDGGPVRPATDVYGLGLLLYRALAGRMPWHAATVTEMVRAHLYTDPAPLPLIPGLPPRVAELCRRCLRKDPKKRPSAAEAAGILAEAAGLMPLPVPAPGVDTVPIRRPARRRRLAGAAAAAVLAVGGAALAWSVQGPDPVRGGATPAAAAVAPPAAPVAAPASRCTVRYTVRTAPGGRLANAVAVVNTGRTALADWRLTFALPSGQRLVRAWDDRWHQQGGKAQVRGARLAPGATATTGFDAAYDKGAATFPTRFEVNGVACEPVLAAVAPAPAAPAVVPLTAGKSGAGSSAKGTATAKAKAKAKAKGKDKAGKDKAGKDKGKGKGKGKSGKG
ncbi:serine/threonine-protein kinase [Actinoplanes sp. NPDC049681]|uniref:serine/threonine-protein kinase n=1 Tax=Actinoplanes sp. NPDC049681 TaxID=3363905 RepID=UPI003798C730